MIISVLRRSPSEWETNHRDARFPALRLAMLQFPLRSGSVAELRWLVAETDALRKFRSEVREETRRSTIEATRRWILGEQQQGKASRLVEQQDLIDGVLSQFPLHSLENWSEKTWEAFVLNFLWRVCQHGVQHAAEIPKNGSSSSRYIGSPESNKAGTSRCRRHRDRLLEKTGNDSDLWVHDVLIRFSAAFLDQGFAEWELPDRDQGMFQSFLTLYRLKGVAVTPQLAQLRREVIRLRDEKISPLSSIAESLEQLGVPANECGDFITATLLALKGWAGMVWQMESNAEWAPHPAPENSLLEFLAIRLILDRNSVAQVARESLGYTGPLSEFAVDAMEPLSNDLHGVRFTRRSARKPIRPATFHGITESKGGNKWPHTPLIQQGVQQAAFPCKSVNPNSNGRGDPALPKAGASLQVFANCVFESVVIVQQRGCTEQLQCA